MLAVRPFLAGRVGDGDELDLGGLRAADVVAFVVARCPAQSRGAAKMTVTALRSLLGFLHLRGLIERAVGRARCRRRRRGGCRGCRARWSPSSCERCWLPATAAPRPGAATYAVLVMLARLGLRAGEVAALRLEDVDWRAGELRIAGKGRRAERLPLPADVGEAIVAYLRDGRPATALDRSLIVRVRAPHHGLTSGGITQIVFAAAGRAGLGPIHAHRLRHTAATQMLRAGASLEEIGQVLRHRQAADDRDLRQGRPRRAARSSRGRGRRGPVMTALEERLAGYLAVRRALGYRLARAEKLLAQFIAWLNERGESTITTELALAWATLPPATDSNWHAHRLSVVRGFAAHVHALDPAHELVPPGPAAPAAAARGALPLHRR